MIISESELKKIRHIFSEMIPTFFHPFTCKGPKGLPSREETCKSLVIYKSLHGWIFKDSFFHIRLSIYSGWRARDDHCITRASTWWNC